jgi:hypothetical protein
MSRRQFAGPAMSSLKVNCCRRIAKRRRFPGYCSRHFDHRKAFLSSFLTAASCTVIRSEKVTGASTERREELATLLQFLREGDTLVVTRIDRLIRSLRDPGEYRSRPSTTRRRLESDRPADRHQQGGGQCVLYDVRKARIDDGLDQIKINRFGDEVVGSSPHDPTLRRYRYRQAGALGPGRRSRIRRERLPRCQRGSL